MFLFEPIDTATFFANDYRMEWLVKRLLVRGQFGVIGGASKTLKTSLSVDLAISLGSGLPFLGVFDVYKPKQAGGGVGSQEKSLAIRLTLASPAATLTDEQIDAAVKAVLERLGARVGGRLRT